MPIKDSYFKTQTFLKDTLTGGEEKHNQTIVNNCDLFGFSKMNDQIGQSAYENSIFLGCHNDEDYDSSKKALEKWSLIYDNLVADINQTLSANINGNTLPKKLLNVTYRALKHNQWQNDEYCDGINTRHRSYSSRGYSYRRNTYDGMYFQRLQLNEYGRGASNSYDDIYVLNKNNAFRIKTLAQHCNLDFSFKTLKFYATTP